MRQPLARCRQSLAIDGMPRSNGIKSKNNTTKPVCNPDCRRVWTRASSTVDCHYPTPDAWKDRELYKRLGYLGRSTKPDWIDKALPESVDDMDYQLYPKNGDEVWESYREYSKELATYDDDMILESITNPPSRPKSCRGLRA